MLHRLNMLLHLNMFYTSKPKGHQDSDSTPSATNIFFRPTLNHGKTLSHGNTLSHGKTLSHGSTLRGSPPKSGSSMHMRCPDGIGREIWDREGRESEGGSRHPSPLKGGGSPSRGVSPGGKERSVPRMRLLLLLYVVVS